MGRNNQARRKAKEKVRKASRQATDARPNSSDEAWSLLDELAGACDCPDCRPGATRATASPQEVAVTLIRECLPLMHRDPSGGASLRRLTEPRSAEWTRAVEGALQVFFTATVANVWTTGWQPVDVMRVTARHAKEVDAVLVRAALAGQLRQYAPVTLDPRWPGQLEDADITVWWPDELTAVQACARDHPGEWGDFVRGAVQTLFFLTFLPALEVLGHLPGTAPPQRTLPATTADERILNRVRALLAKAESTPYPAEAETFTAGAQALMARHSIDHALLAATGQTGDERPHGRRIGVDNPYETQKALLLSGIASANRCRTVWAKNLGHVTVIGFATDLDSVELLFTSLLVQATTALTREGSRVDRDGRSRTRSFRQTFLQSYAERIRQRLTESTQEQTVAAAAESGNGDLLPVLASRSQAVDDAVGEMFPAMTMRRIGSTAHDREGWAAGRALADLASLSPAEQVGARQAR